jgi:uncharacterized membrane protein YjjB (DUF3815 family)
MSVREILQIISGGIGTLGFCVLFNIRGRRLVVTVIGGFLSWLLFVLLCNFISSEPINYFIVAAVISFYAEIMARIVKTPTTTFITTALIPLIPGGSLYYTMAYAFHSNIDRFLEKAIYTLQLASALALGIIIATTISRISFNFLGKRKIVKG